jgi:hypothetical protein
MHTRNAIEQALQGREIEYRFLQTNGGGWAVVVPELGAKVLAAAADGENAFWVNPKLESGTWCAGGQRNWLAPELGSKGFFGTGVEDWRVPTEMDPGSYRLIDINSGELTFQNDLTIERLDGRSFALGIVRSIRLDTVREERFAPGLKIRIDNRLINRMDRKLDREVGLWHILQVPAEEAGTFLIPLIHPSTHEPSEKPYRLYFGDLPPDWKSVTPSLLYIKAFAGKWFKIGIPPVTATGALGFLCPSRVDDQHILTIMRTAVDPSARYIDKPPHQAVDNGDALQCYNSPDRETLNFCELEAHTPAAPLDPGEEQKTQVEILLFKDRLENLCGAACRLLAAQVDPERTFCA